MSQQLTPLKGSHVNVAMMTSGGLAPCLSSSIAQLVTAWVAAYKNGEVTGVSFRFYIGGYKGILTGNSFTLSSTQVDKIAALNSLGGSPIGSSRVKLTNVADCIKRGYVKEGETPLEVAAQQLLKDEIHVLHTIGGDDTNTQAAELSDYLMEKHSGKVIVIGMPKTVDNDVYPIVQTFGAQTAAEQGALFFKNVVNECSASPRMLVLHECMGRDSGYLTAATAFEYRKLLLDQANTQQLFGLPQFPYATQAARDVHAIWIPELKLDLLAEGVRLKAIMDKVGCVNVFFGEGTGVQEIVADMESRGEDVPRDAFGHVALAKVNPGQYFTKHLAEAVGAEKTLVQKSGYFARSAAANNFDVDLIGKCAVEGVKSAVHDGVPGCMGQDEDKEGTPVRAIEFSRIKGHKPFDIGQTWFQQTLKEIGQI